MANQVDYTPCKYTGNGSTTEFSFDWKIFTATDITVRLEVISTGVQTTLTYGTDYTVSFGEIAGYVKLNTAPAATSYVIITREVSDYQSKTYSTSTGFQGSEIENSFDKVSCNLQELEYSVDRAIKVPVGSAKLNMTLPLPASNKILKWNEEETGIENSTVDATKLETIVDRIDEVSIDNIDIVATNITSVNTVADNISDVNSVAGNKANINTVAGSIGNINNVGNNITSVTTVASNTSNINAVVSNIGNVNNVGNNITKVNTVADNISSVNTASSNMSAIIAAPTNASIAQSSATAAQNAANRAQMYASDITSGGFIWTPVAIADWTLNSGTGKYEKTINVTDVPAIIAAYKGVWNNKEVVDVDIVSNGTSHKIISYDAFDGYILGSITVLQSEYDDYAVVSAMAAMEEAKDWASKTTGKVDDDNYSAKYYAQAASSSAATATAAASSQNIITIINNMSDIDTVASNSSNITTVAGNIANVNSVASNSSNITTVAGSIANVNSVAADLTNIDSVAADLTNIDAASSNATLASEWATKMDGKVNNEDYSAKYYASQAAQGQVQSDWTEADSTSKAYILNKPTIPDAQIQSDWNQTDTDAKDYIKNKPTIPTVPTALSSFTDDLGSSPTHTHSQYVTDISGKEDILKTVNVLSTSGTITLSDNSINTITPSAAVTFSLPTVTDNTKFHQILVQVNLSTVYTLTLGTSYYFNSTAPDMSNAGIYNLIFEYDKANSYWVAGVISKGASA
jgi:hypothetical protein